MSERGRGRPSHYAPEFVRDISVQVLIGFYNSQQGTLRERMTRDPDYPSKLREKAQYMDHTVRTWLIALDSMKGGEKFFKREVAFRSWCLRLEPAWPLDLLAEHPAKEAELRGVMEKHFTAEYLRIYADRWIEAIERVRTDSCFALRLPSMYVHNDEDDYL